MSSWRTEQEFGEAEFVVDCRLEKRQEGQEAAVPIVKLRGADIKLEGTTPGNYQRFSITVKDRAVIVKRNDQETQRSTLPADAPTRGAFGLNDTGDALEFMNLYARDL